MTTYRIKAEVKITYMFDVEAESPWDAIDIVENDEEEPSQEIANSAPVATEYAVEGQAGWNSVPE